MSESLERQAEKIQGWINNPTRAHKKDDLKIFQKELIRREKLERGKKSQRDRLTAESKPIPPELKPTDLSSFHTLLDEAVAKRNA